MQAMLTVPRPEPPGPNSYEHPGQAGLPFMQSFRNIVNTLLVGFMQV